NPFVHVMAATYSPGARLLATEIFTVSDSVPLSDVRLDALGVNVMLLAVPLSNSLSENCSDRLPLDSPVSCSLSWVEPPAGIVSVGLEVPVVADEADTENGGEYNVFTNPTTPVVHCVNHSLLPPKPTVRVLMSLSTVVKLLMGGSSTLYSVRRVAPS